MTNPVEELLRQIINDILAGLTDPQPIDEDALHDRLAQTLEESPIVLTDGT